MKKIYYPAALLCWLLLLPLKAQAQWKGSLEGGYSTTQGNADSETWSVKGKTGHKFQLRENRSAEINLAGKSIYGRREGEVNSNYWQTKIDAKYWHEKSHIFLNNNVESNRVAGYTLKVSTSAGIGGRAESANKKHSLLLEVGPGLVTVNRMNSENQFYVSGRAYGLYEYKVTTFKFSQEAEYLHDFTDPANWSSSLESAVEFKLNNHLSFKTSVEIKYINQPAEDAKSTDVFTGSYIVYNF